MAHKEDSAYLIELVKKSLAGDSIAWRKFFCHYKPIIEGKIAKRLLKSVGSVNQEHLNDVFSQTWQKLVKDDYKNLKKTIGRSPTGWICIIADRTCIDYLGSAAVKKERITNPIPEEDPSDEESHRGVFSFFKTKKKNDSILSEDNIIDYLENKETLEAVRKIVSRLSTEEKIVFNARIRKCLSFEEIGAIIKKDKSTASRIYKRMIKKFQEKLRQE